MIVERMTTVRRPITSAIGEMKIAPVPMPTRPAESSTPSVAGSTPHSLATSGAVNDMASTSKPSTMLSTTQMTTTTTWNEVMLPSRKAWRGSLLISLPQRAAVRMLAEPLVRIHRTAIMPTTIAATKSRTILRPEASETTAGPGQ